MALTAKERRMVEELTERQRQLEMIIGRAFGGSLGGAFVNLYHENPLNSPLTNLSQHNMDAAMLGKEIRTSGGRRRVKQKAKRKVSGYQKEFGKQLKKLKKAHPRTKIGTLMKRAHRATKRVRK